MIPHYLIQINSALYKGRRYYVGKVNGHFTHTWREQEAWPFTLEQGEKFIQNVTDYKRPNYKLIRVN
jgi:hypothetical protein